MFLSGVEIVNRCNEIAPSKHAVTVQHLGVTNLLSESKLGTLAPGELDDREISLTNPIHKETARRNTKHERGTLLILDIYKRHSVQAVLLDDLHVPEHGTNQVGKYW